MQNNLDIATKAYAQSLIDYYTNYIDDEGVSGAFFPQDKYYEVVNFLCSAGFSHNDGTTIIELVRYIRDLRNE